MSTSQKRLVSLLVITIAALAVIVSLIGDRSLKAASGAGPIGFVYSSKIISQVERLPEYIKAQKDYETFAQKLQTEYDSESEGLDEDSKRKKFAELEMKLAEKQVELNKPFQDKIQTTIEEVAKSEGCSIVLSQRVEFDALIPIFDKNEGIVGTQYMPMSIPVVVTGGKDLTEPVLKKLGVK